MKRICHLALLLGCLSCLALGQGQYVPVPTVCNRSAVLQMTTATTTQLVALSSGQQIRVCAYAVQGSASATATTLRLVYGTGTNCATAPVNLTPAWNMPASATTMFVKEGFGVGEVFQTAAGNALCATNSAAGTVNIRVTYAQF